MPIKQIPLEEQVRNMTVSQAEVYPDRPATAPRPMGADYGMIDSVVAGVERSKSDHFYMIASGLTSLFGLKNDTFDKKSFYQAEFGEDDTYFDAFMDQVENPMEANFFAKSIRAHQDVEYVQRDQNLLSNLLTSVATDPEAIALGMFTGPALSMGKTVLQKAAIGAGEGAAYEALKQAQQPMRTGTESAITIGAGAVLGPLVGMNINKLPGSKGAKKMFNKVFESGKSGELDPNNIPSSSVGAFQNKFNTVTTEFYDRFEGATGGLSTKVLKTMSKITPSERLFSNESLLMRELMAKLSTPASVSKGTKAGIAPTYSVRDYKDEVTNIVSKTRFGFVTQKNELKKKVYRGETGLDPNMKAIQIEQKLTDDVWKASNYTDMDTLRNLAANSDDYYLKTVNKLALERRQMYERLFEMAEKAGMSVNKRQFYAGLQRIDPKKITNENRLELLGNIRDQIEKFSIQSAQKLEGKVTELQALKQAFLRSAIDNDELAERILIRRAQVEGQGITNKDIDELIEGLATKGNEARIMAKQALERARKAEDEWRKAIGNAEDFKTAMRYLPQHILNRIESGVGQSGLGVTKRGGEALPHFFKSRVFETKKFEPWLDKNLSGLDSAYAKNFGTKYGMKVIYGSSDAEEIFAGYKDMVARQQGFLSDVADGLRKGDDTLYNRYLQGPDEQVAKILSKTGKDVDAISKSFDDLAKGLKTGEEEFFAMVERQLGTYHSEAYNRLGVAGPILYVADLALTMAKMGFLSISMINEVFSPVMQGGLKSLNSQFKIVPKLIRRDKQLMSIGEDMAVEVGNLNNYIFHADLGNVMQDSGEVAANYVRGAARYERGQKRFFDLNLAAPFDRILRVSAELTNDIQFYRTAGKVADGTASPRELEMFARYGFNKEEAAMVYKEVGKNRIKHKKSGMTFTDMDGLASRNPELAFRVRTAKRRSMEDVILTAKEGDTPHAMSHPVVRLITKFKSWPLMATQRFMVKGLQHNDAQTWASWSFMTVIGMGLNELQDAVVGRDNSDLTLSDRIYAGMSKSGFWGLSHELGLDYMANLAGNQGAGAGYIDYTSPLEKTVGASGSIFDAAEDVFGLGKTLADPDESIDDLGQFYSSTRNLVKLLPGNQYVRAVLDRND